MKKKEATLDYLNLQVKDSFNFKNGQQSNSLKELLDAIKTVDNETFKHHLNEEKNDFSAWIRHSIGNQLLANKIAQANTKEEVISAIDGITHKKEGEHMSDDQNKESSEINNLIDELEQETKDLSQTSKELEKAAVQDIPESSKEPTLGGTPDLIDEESEKKQKKGVFKKMFSKKEQDREEIVPADLELKEQPPILTETPPPESGEDLETIDMSTEQKESKKINDTVSKKVKDKPTKKEAKTDKEEEIPDIPDIPSGKISEQTVEPLTDEKPDENEPKLDDVDDIPFPTDFVTNDSDEMEDAEPLSLHEEVAAEAKKQPKKKGVFKKIFGKKKKEDTVQETPVQPQEDIPMDIPTPEEIFSQEETPAVEPPISDELDIPLPEEHEKESDEIILEKEPQEL
ncbi:hypothetical protein GOV08_00790, partial [Candidatus Woesearchaeota archaeon]|nr:hypothetical protein [Candidatus Woesearchaeota archaeon]